MPASPSPTGRLRATAGRQFSLPALLLLSCLWLAAAAGTLAGAQTQSLDLSQPPQQWQTLFTDLASHPRIESDFAERRFFAFRKNPRRLEGTMHFDHRHGMALEYRSPARYTVFVNPAEGIRILRGSGESQNAPDNAAATAMLRIMPRLMQFSAHALAEDFSATAEGDPQGEWLISLRPLERSQLPHIQEIRLQGTADLLQRLTLVRGPHERSEIDMQQTRFPAEGAPDAINWNDQD